MSSCVAPSPHPDIVLSAISPHRQNPMPTTSSASALTVMTPLPPYTTASRTEIMKWKSTNFESVQKFVIIAVVLDDPTQSIGSPSPTAMENPVDRTIRLMALAAGVVSLLVLAVFHFL